MSTEREVVFAVINGERAYQDGLSHTRTDGCAKGVGDYLSLMRTYLHEAEEAYARNAGNEKALHSVRKVAALAVRCMEEHGAPPRVIG